MREDLKWVNAIPLPVLLVTRNEHVMAMNDPAQQLFGSQYLGRHIVTVIRQPGVLEAVTGSVRLQTEQQARMSLRDHVHETLYKVVCAPCPDIAGVGAVISFQDVTLEETAGQMRRDFVANVSHELRTPLTALQGFIETLQGPAYGDLETTQRFLATMAREAERMNRLVSDLLSLSQVEGEERVRPTERVNIREILAQVARVLQPVAALADVRIDDTGDIVAPWILGDPDQLTQVFTNLAENAIKYGADGGRVELRLSDIVRDPILGQKALQVDVQDWGQGFDQMHIPRLTERFYRVDNHRSHQLGGTGLGLAIVKHIVNRHKGHLRIHSELGAGSCFSVILPRP